jgi:hypothetical protein
VEENAICIVLDRGFNLDLIGPCTPYGTCRNVNQYLKWNFVEASTRAIRLKVYRDSHVGLLFNRLAPGKEHGRAIVPVVRHLAKARYWVLCRAAALQAPCPRTIAA